MRPEPKGDEVEIRLYAFWPHDQYPFVLGGEASKMRPDGYVYIESFRGWFKPLRMFPVATGHEIHGKLKTSEDEYKKARAEFDISWGIRADQLSGGLVSLSQRLK